MNFCEKKLYTIYFLKKYDNLNFFCLFYFYLKIVPWGDEESIYNETRDLDCDIIVTGHTHELRISKFEKKYIMNPGSFTGAYSPLKQ